MPEAVLAADLTELARPVGNNTGKAGVGQMSIAGTAAPIEAPPDGPAAIHTVFGRGVQAKSVLRLENAEWRELIARAPEQLRAEQEILINGATQWLPAEGSVRSVQVGEETGTGVEPQVAVTSRIGKAEIEVGRFGQIRVAAEVADDAQILAPVGHKHGRGIAAKDLRGALEEPFLGGGKKAGDREAGIVDAVFPANEIVGRERTVDVGERMVVNGIDLAEIGAHLADLQQQSGRERREGYVGLFHIDPGFAKGDEGVGAGVGIDDRLHADLGFMQ